MTPKEKALAIDAVTKGTSTAVEALERLARTSSTLKRAAAWALAIGQTPMPGTSKEDNELVREQMAQLIVDCYSAGFIAALEVK
jgi:hypothetical protein